MKTFIRTLLAGIGTCSIVISLFIVASCKSEERADKANTTSKELINTISETEEFVYSQSEIEESEPNVYLPSEIAPVMRAGAGFLGTVVSARLESVHSKDVSVGIDIYAGSEKVGYTIVTIKKGELEGEEETRLDGFMGWFEDRIPSTVNLEITSVRESAF